jgi:hypothetical protein
VNRRYRVVTQELSFQDSMGMKNRTDSNKEVDGLEFPNPIAQLFAGLLAALDSSDRMSEINRRFRG